MDTASLLGSRHYLVLVISIVYGLEGERQEINIHNGMMLYAYCSLGNKKSRLKTEQWNKL